MDSMDDKPDCRDINLFRDRLVPKMIVTKRWTQGSAILLTTSILSSFSGHPTAFILALTFSVTTICLYVLFQMLLLRIEIVQCQYQILKIQKENNKSYL